MFDDGHLSMWMFSHRIQKQHIKNKIPSNKGKNKIFKNDKYMQYESLFNNMGING